MSQNLEWNWRLSWIQNNCDSMILINKNGNEKKIKIGGEHLILPNHKKHFLSAMSFSHLLLLHYPKILTKTKILTNQVNSNVNNEFLQKILPKKVPPKINPPKKFLTKNSSKKILQKKSKNIQTISQKIPKTLKISNSLHRT